MPVKTISDQIRDNLTRNQIDVLRLEEGLRNKVVGLLNKTRDEICGVLAAQENLTEWRKARLNVLLKDIHAILDKNYLRMENGVTDALKQMAALQAEVIPDVLNSAVGASIFGKVTLTEGLLVNLVEKSGLQGRLMSEWWGRAKDATKERLSEVMTLGMEQLQVGMTQGEALNALIGRIRGTAVTPGALSISKREAAALVRTSSMQVMQAVRQEIYDANEDILNGIQVVATLDGRTTPLCRALDGKQYDLNRKPLDGAPPLPDGPPFHWNCRSTLIPITKSYKELAGKSGPLSKSQRSKLENIPPSQRASMGGPVEGTMDYQEWLLSQPEEVQIEALGERRQRIWKSKGLRMTDLIHQSGRELSIRELREKYGLVREKKASPVKKAVKPEPEPTQPKTRARVEWERIAEGRQLNARVEQQFDIEALRFRTTDRKVCYAVNRIAEALCDVQNALPELDLPPLQRLMVIPKSTIEANSSVTGRYSQLGSRYAEIKVAAFRSGWDRPEQLNIGRDWSIATGVSKTTRHEYGHHFWYKVLSEGERQEWESLFNRKKAADAGYWARKVSGYANTKPTECFSECFAGYTSPLYKKSTTKLPDEVEQFFDRMRKTWRPPQ